jgi:anthranilate synthase component 2
VIFKIKLETMKILVIDNYDSFTYNLVHYLKEISGEAVDVYRNDKISIEEASKYDKILISPGPGIPKDAGITLELIGNLGETKSILGICLGCQAIAEVYGGKIINLDKVYHGVATYMKVLDLDEKIFSGIPESFTAGRYHSWVVDRDSLPETLILTAEDNEGQVMAVSHVKHKVKGLQFHPESVLTRYGKQMIHNWLEN